MRVLFAHSSLNVDFQNPLRPQFLFKIGIIRFSTENFKNQHTGENCPKV